MSLSERDIEFSSVLRRAGGDHNSRRDGEGFARYHGLFIGSLIGFGKGERIEQDWPRA